MTNTNQPRRSQKLSGVSRLPAFLPRRTIVSDVVQGIIAGGVLAFFVVLGIIVGGVLAFFTANLVISPEVHAMHTTVNGWSTTLKCGKPGSGILLRAACAEDIAALSLPEDEVYWQTFVDSAVLNRDVAALDIADFVETLPDSLDLASFTVRAAEQ